MSTLPRVVLAEDDVLLREAASLLDRSGFQVVGQAGDAAGLLGLAAEQAPELVVVDIRMPPTHTSEGLEAAPVIRQQHPAVGIVVLSAHVEVEHAMELLAGGRVPAQEPGYRRGGVPRHPPADRQGRSVVDPAGGRAGGGPPPRRPAGRAQPPREREVLALMAGGRSNAGIARRLWVTEARWKSTSRSILTKLTLPETEDDHRRVLAVLTFLDSR